MSAVAFEPVRPHMPVEGRSLDEWADYYDGPLSVYYRALHRHYANHFERNAFTSRQYKYQLELDAIEKDETI